MEDLDICFDSYTHVKIFLNLDSNKFPKIGIGHVRINLEFESRIYVKIRIFMLAYLDSLSPNKFRTTPKLLIQFSVHIPPKIK